MRTVEDLVHEIRAAGVTLRPEGEMLRFSGPKGALTDLQLTSLKRRKGEILQFLRQEAWGDGTEAKTLIRQAYLHVAEDWNAIARPRGHCPCSIDQRARLIEADAVHLEAWWMAQVAPDAPITVAYRSQDAQALHAAVVQFKEQMRPIHEKAATILRRRARAPAE